MEREIPVLFVIDKKFIQQLAVVLQSLISSADENTKYKVFVLVPEVDYEIIRDKINSLFKDKRIDIQIVSVKDERINGLGAGNQLFSKVVFYRLFADMFIEGYDKCIYLDTDIVVCGNLSELYQVELGDNYFGAIKDYELISDEKKSLEKKEELAIEDISMYVNSGVLLINLKLLREKSIKPMLILESQVKHNLPDQDVLNKCCYGKILHLPIRYNMRNFYLNNNPKRESITHFETVDYVNKEVENVCVIHYASQTQRPWNRKRVMGEKLWWSRAKEILSNYEIESLSQNLKETLDIRDCAELCNSKENVFFYGYTMRTKALLNKLKGCNVKQLEAVIDKNAKRLNQENPIVPIKTLEEVEQELSDARVFNMGLGTKEEITSLLVEKGVPERNIIEFYSLVVKDEEYYTTLPNDEYENEFLEILQKEGIKYCEIVPEEIDLLLERYPGLKELYYLENWILYKG